MQLSENQYAGLQAMSRDQFEKELSDWLRAHRAAYVDDLTDAQLDRVAKKAVKQCDKLELFGKNATRAFGSAATVYGVYSYIDPLFEDIYYARLPRARARMRVGAQGLWEGLARVLDAEFTARSGCDLILALGEAFLGDTYPDMEPEALLKTYFPERLARLAPGQLEAHLSHSQFQAERLGLTEPDALRFHRDVALLLGAYFSMDPLYPWAQAAFDGGQTDAERTSRLRAALLVIVRQVRTQMEGEN